MTVVRITRDAEVEIEDDSIGFRELVLEQVRQRRYEPVVRLEFGPGADPDIKEMLRKRFEIDPSNSTTCPRRSITPPSRADGASDSRPARYSLVSAAAGRDS